VPWILHVSVKMLSCLKGTTSNFEVTPGDTVIAKAAIEVTMQTDNTLIDIDAEDHLDRVTAEQLAKIVEFLLNLED
jgi:hypothetical protein